jgi:hypothetical protein
VNSRFRVIVAIGLIVSLFTASFSAAAQDNGDNDDIDIDVDHQFEVHGFDFHDPEFFDVWARTDYPVLEGEVERSWLWGPAANTPLFDEPYVEADDSTRGVQYSDKSRMEMPVPDSDAAADSDDSPWAITQGLLALELMTGELQLGDDTFVPFAPAEIPVAGDLSNNDGPTYADMAAYMDHDARTTGWDITQYFDDEGVVQDDDSYADYGVYDRYYIQETDHNIASVFWDFMQSEGLIYDGEDFEEGPLFLNEFYAIGFPTTEAYWGEFTLRGEVQDILVQCFERRCLTYAPNNPEEWQVESGNVGLHYHEWRYNIIQDPLPPDPVLSLALDQTEEVNIVGTSHEFTATLSENGDGLDIDDADDVEVSIDRDDADLDPIDDLNVSVTDNVATISYTGPDAAAIDTIDVSVDVDGEVIAGEPSLTKTWVTAAEFYDCDDVVETDNGTIQDAIDDAEDGDIVCVEPGTYDENIVIDVDGLTLFALEGPEETTIISDISGSGAGESEGVVGINADGVVLDGFTIDNDDNFDDTDSRAIRVNASVDGLTIQNNVLADSYRGVQGDWDGTGGENITIENNTFNTALGIAGTEDMDELVIIDNTFNNTIEGIGLGEGLGIFSITDNYFAASDGSYVADYRDTVVPEDLEDIILDNEFENEVEVDGNAIVNADDD